jgi:hypothetical protein
VSKNKAYLLESDGDWFEENWQFQVEHLRLKVWPYRLIRIQLQRRQPPLHHQSDQDRVGSLEYRRDISGSHSFLDVNSFKALS